MKKMIKVSANFQHSINIGYDIGDDTKLKNFIPTPEALDLLEEILSSVQTDSSERAAILIGAYGKGKSHIVLAILSILMRRQSNLFKRLLSKTKGALRKLLQSFYDSKIKLFPVIISGSYTSLSQAFLLSLQRALSQNNFQDIMPEKNYRTAVRVIARWKKDFPATFDQLKNKIDIPIENFIQRLKNFDLEIYKTFEALYLSLTAGNIFNPFVSFDVPEIYETVAKALKAKGFSGIFVVYDEFSKFLESNILSAIVSYTKTLQDFAEKCSRSGNTQLHLLLISHKEISNYIDKLPQKKTDGWRGLSERFKHFHLVNNFNQTYEIIPAVIKHNYPAWSNFCTKYKKNFAAVIDRYTPNPMFKDYSGNMRKMILGSFPLHPVSVFILPRLSEMVAQNERTLFTFLSAEGRSTLQNFLNSYQNDFLCPSRKNGQKKSKKKQVNKKNIVQKNWDRARK